MRGWLIVIALTACGRVSFEATHDGGSGDAPSDAVSGPQLAENQVALGVGGTVRRVVVPGASMSSLYALYGRSRLLYSDDAGETFSDCGAIPTYVTAVDANSAGRVVVATARGVYESTDACRTFTLIGLQNGWVNTVRLDGDVLYSGPLAGLHRYDAPQWTLVPSPVDGTLTYDILPGAVKLLGGDGTVGMLRSTDGITWTPSSTGMTAGTAILRITGSGASIWTATTSGLYLSTDGGMSWTSRHSGWSDVIAMDPADPASLAHWWANGYVASSDGGMTWVDMEVPELARARIIDAVYDPGGSGVVVFATGRGLFRMDKTLAVRELATNIDAWSIMRSIATPTARLLATSAGVIRIPADGGGHALIDAGPQEYSEIRDLVMLGGAVLAAGRSICRSDDDGQTYAEVYIADGTDDFHVAALTSTSDVAYAITDARVLRTTNGVDWLAATIATANYNTLGVVPGVPDHIVAGSDQAGIYASTDGGMTFSQVSTTRSIYGALPMPDGSVLVATGSGVQRAATAAGPYAAYSLGGEVVLALALRGPTTVFAATAEDIRKSTDGGMTFATIPGFGGRAPVSLEVEPATGDLLVGTAGFGFYRIPNP